MIGTIISVLYRYSQLKKLAETPRVKAAIERLKVEWDDLPKELRVIGAVCLGALLFMLLLV